MRTAAIAMLSLVATLLAWLVWPLTGDSHSIEVRPAIQDSPAALTAAIVASNHELPSSVAAAPLSSLLPESPLHFPPPVHATGKTPALEAPAPAMVSNSWPSREPVPTISSVFSPDPAVSQLSETFEVRVPDLTGQGPATIPAALAELPAATAPEISMAPDIAAGTAAMAEEFVSQLEAVPAQADEQTYREAWDSAQAESDALFKARYGERAWMQHHIQAHHQSQTQP
jgi:hypothetical protein